MFNSPGVAESAFPPFRCCARSWGGGDLTGSPVGDNLLTVWCVTPLCAQRNRLCVPRASRVGSYLEIFPEAGTLPIKWSLIFALRVPLAFCFLVV